MSSCLYCIAYRHKQRLRNLRVLGYFILTFIVQSEALLEGCMGATAPVKRFFGKSSRRGGAKSNPIHSKNGGEYRHINDFFKRRGSNFFTQGRQNPLLRH